MPHTHSKKSSKDSAKAPEPKAKPTDKSALRNKSFAEGDEALKPKDDKKSEGVGAFASFKAALGFGTKATPAERRAVNESCEHYAAMIASANDVQGRCNTVRELGAKDDIPPALSLRCGKVASLCGKFESAVNRLADAHSKFLKDGQLEPIKAAMHAAAKAADAVKMELYGHTGAGDSVSASALLYNPLLPLVGGKQLGERDKASGKTLTGDKQDMPDGAVVLPLFGSSSWPLYCRAIRNYAGDFAQRYDLVIALRGGF